jgi:hypothetical protein
MQATFSSQPPSQAKVETRLSPSPVGRLHVQEYNPNVYHFGMIVLLDGSGRTVADGLSGITSVTGNVSGAPTDGSPADVSFTFHECSVNNAGSHQLRLDIYEVAHGRANGAQLVKQVKSDSFGTTRYITPSDGPSQLRDV